MGLLLRWLLITFLPLQPAAKVVDPLVELISGLAYYPVIGLAIPKGGLDNPTVEEATGHDLDALLGMEGTLEFYLYNALRGVLWEELDALNWPNGSLNLSPQLILQLLKEGFQLTPISCHLFLSVHSLKNDNP